MVSPGSAKGAYTRTFEATGAALMRRKLVIRTRVPDKSCSSTGVTSNPIYFPPSAITGL